eukprot:jgi/Psemu1/300560/fgenesh1_kg.14_\
MHPWDPLRPPRHHHRRRRTPPPPPRSTAVPGVFISIPHNTQQQPPHTNNTEDRETTKA